MPRKKKVELQVEVVEPSAQPVEKMQSKNENASGHGYGGLYGAFLKSCNDHERGVYGQNVQKGMAAFRKWFNEQSDAKLIEVI